MIEEKRLKELMFELVKHHCAKYEIDHCEWSYEPSSYALTIDGKRETIVDINGDSARTIDSSTSNFMSIDALIKKTKTSTFVMKLLRFVAANCPKASVQAMLVKEGLIEYRTIEKDGHDELHYASWQIEYDDVNDCARFAPNQLNESDSRNEWHYVDEFFEAWSKEIAQ